MTVSISPQVTTISRATEERTITVWQYLEWRCEYWQGNAAPELRLYRGEQLFQLAHPRDTFETLQRSARWHSDLPIPELRSGLDRRAVPRGGRRAADQSA